MGEKSDVSFRSNAIILSEGKRQTYHPEHCLTTYVSKCTTLYHVFQAHSHILESSDDVQKRRVQLQSPHDARDQSDLDLHVHFLFDRPADPLFKSIGLDLVQGLTDVGYEILVVLYTN